MRVTFSSVLVIACTVIASSQGDSDDDEKVFYPEEHHYHHHHHHYYHGPEGKQEQDFGNEGTANNSILEIPLDFVKELSNFNTSELLARFVEGEEQSDEQIFLQDRFAERDAAVTPKPATCIPELQTISLYDSKEDSSILFIPSCTRIERCGGCCTHSLLECQPTDSETVNFQVFKTKYTGSQKLRFVEKKIVQVERHIKCKCDCRIREEHCNAFQVYNKNSCRCVCRNKDEEKKCLKRGDVKIWNPDLCACQCREERPCSSGTVYDVNQCKCVSPVRRRFVGEDPENMPVVPLKVFKIK